MATQKQIVKTKFFTNVRDLEPNEKCPPQAALILNTIKAGGGKVEKEALLALLKREPAEGGLTTRQPAERILSFYRPKLIAMGVLGEVVEETEIEVEVPDKPAKEPKAAAEAPVTVEGAEGEAPVQVAPKAKQEQKSKKGAQQAA